MRRFSLNHHRSRVPALLLLCLWAVCGAAAAAQTVPQGPVITEPAAEAGGLAPQPEGETVVVETLPATGTGCCVPEDYWVVSFRGCPQNQHQCLNPCCQQYFHHTADGCLTGSDHPTFLASLIPGAPICFMIHGSYVTWESAQWDALRTFRWLRNAAPHMPMNYVYITWPSDPSCPPADLILLGRKSENMGFQFAELIRSVPREYPISFIGHSHGARIVLSTLHLLGGGQLHGYGIQHPPGASHRFRVVLAAAALDHDWLNPGERYGCALPITECLLSMRTRHDRALAFYPLRYPFAKKSLGRKGFTSKDRRKLGWLSCRVAECDVTNMIQHHHFWQYYVRFPNLAHSVVPYAYYPDIQQQQAAATPMVPAP